MEPVSTAGCTASFTPSGSTGRDSGEDDSPTFAEYADILEKEVPGLFDGSYRVVTEFGRAVIAKCAYTIAKVEYTKTMGGRHIALTHAGAQVATRTVFMPQNWKLTPQAAAHG